MNVTFIGGPLDGNVRDIDDAHLGSGAVLLVPAGALEDATDIPGDERMLEYLYDEERGTARYVAGLIPGTGA
jgi:hypothetical protein